MLEDLDQIHGGDGSLNHALGTIIFDPRVEISRDVISNSHARAIALIHLRLADSVGQRHFRPKQVALCRHCLCNWFSAEGYSVYKGAQAYR